MLIPHEFDVSMAEQYKQKVRQRMIKAKHLSERVKLFLKDVETGKFKESDKKAIIQTILNAINKEK